jgi:uncharacterized metal-binding protein YceD (DUF177 family)
MITHTKFPISFELEKLSSDGREECFNLSTEFLKELEGRFQVLSLDFFKGEFLIVPIKKSFRLSVTYKAAVSQACVVTATPVVDEIEESFDVRIEFAVEPENLGMDEETLMNEEDTEYVPDGVVDVGDIISQYLATALNPFPRIEGAEFSGVGAKGLHVLSEAEDKETRNPFAVLKKLKDKG